MRANFFLSLVVTAAAFTLNDATLAESAPDTPKKPVSTEYHGVTVEDPYQWLEADDDLTGESVVGRAESANPPISRQIAGPGGN